MIYKKCQSIILLEKNISTYQMEIFIEDITKFMCKYVDKIKITQIENNYVAVEFRCLIRGYKKRINMIKEKLNTFTKVVNFKILDNLDNKEEIDKKANEIYIVYEFDYGSIKKEIEARSTIFGAYRDKNKAKEKAYSLLQEGLDNYCLSSNMKKLNNPFTIYDEVALYEKECKQKEVVYYIKIEKINLV